MIDSKIYLMVGLRVNSIFGLKVSLTILGIVHGARLEGIRRDFP